MMALCVGSCVYAAALWLGFVRLPAPLYLLLFLSFSFKKE
jgi:hypothetical protein